MKKSAFIFLLAFAPLLTAFAAPNSPNAAATLPQNARLAVVGDSITEWRLYSKLVEAYILACSGRADVRVFQFGWSGRTAGGFADRGTNDLAFFQPTTVTLCFGMNDGGYQPFNESIGKRYEDNMRRVLNFLRGNGVKHVVVGSPGAVDTFYFHSIIPEAEGTSEWRVREWRVAKELIHWEREVALRSSGPIGLSRE